MRTPELGAPSETPPASGLRRPLLAAAVTTMMVTAASYLTPDRYAATLVGVAFLASTWWLVLRHEALTVRSYGLSLGGVLEPAPLDPRRLLRDTLVAIGWALLLATLALPVFTVGYRLDFHPIAHFVFRPRPSLFDDFAGQIAVIALPEEAFFRGYLQTALDGARPRWRVLGADLGPGWLLSAAIFAVGHVLTVPQVPRLAVFFPALIFGWMFKRTGGIVAPILFHAACNLCSATL